MRIVIIGGKGHVGTYLVPRLIELGHEVVNVSRGKSEPYLPHAAWNQVQEVQADRTSEEAAGIFGKHIADLKPDTVIDMICFTLESARHIAGALRGRIQHFLSCGTIWIHGYQTEAPAAEEQCRNPFGEYGIQKDAMEKFLLAESRSNGFPATVLHPGHIVGPGHIPINPVANKSLGPFNRLFRGEELLIPNFGLETLHHVHADDVAQAFIKAMYNRSCAVGEGFHVVSPAALTLRGYAETAASWFGKEPKLRFMPFEEWRKAVDHTEEEIGTTLDHISRSSNLSIRKAERLLGYQPRYTSLEAIHESVMWLVEHGRIGSRPKV